MGMVWVRPPARNSSSPTCSASRRRSAWPAPSTSTTTTRVGNGLLAALLAEAGYDANPAVLEHKQGFFNAFNGPGNYDADKIFDHWADPLEVTGKTMGPRMVAVADRPSEQRVPWSAPTSRRQMAAC
jgi:hypothetical protein